MLDFEVLEREDNQNDVERRAEDGSTLGLGEHKHNLRQQSRVEGNQRVDCEEERNLRERPLPD